LGSLACHEKPRRRRNFPLGTDCGGMKSVL
jgi:hypothetical protein